MSEMIDRVAKALFDKVHEHPYLRNLMLGNDPNLGFHNCATSVREDYRKQARAAIEAMREPTEKMREAPRASLIYAGDYLMNEHEADGAWRTMIDAALKEPSQTSDTNPQPRSGP